MFMPVLFFVVSLGVLGLYESHAGAAYADSCSSHLVITGFKNKDDWNAVSNTGENRNTITKALVAAPIHGYVNYLNDKATYKSSNEIEPYDLGWIGGLIADAQNGELVKRKGKYVGIGNENYVYIDDNLINWVNGYVKQYLIDRAIQSTLSVGKYYPHANKAVDLQALGSNGNIDSLKGKLELKYSCAIHPLVGVTYTDVVDTGTIINFEGNSVVTHGSYTRSVMNNGSNREYTGLMGTGQSFEGFRGTTINGIEIQPVNVINTMYNLTAPSRLKYLSDGKGYTPLEDPNNSSVALTEILKTNSGEVMYLELLSYKTFKAKAEFAYEKLSDSSNFRVPTNDYYVTRSKYLDAGIDEDGQYQEGADGSEIDGVVIMQTSFCEAVEYKEQTKDENGKKNVTSKMAFTGRRVKLSGAPVQNPFNANEGGMQVGDSGLTVKSVAYAKDATFGNDVQFNIGFDDTWGAYIALSPNGVEEAKAMEWLNSSEGQRLFSEMNPGANIADVLKGISLAISLSREALTYEEIQRMNEIKRELKVGKEANSYKFVFVTLACIGIVLVFYSVLLVAAYFIDVFGIFGDLKLLTIITFGGLYAIEDNEEIGYGKSSKYVTKGQILIKAGVCMLFGVLLIYGGDVYVLISRMYLRIEALLSGRW